MKILKIEFENINSLKGKWCIDFTDPSFEINHNIFIIHGHTGSGKTSILDAITLGLYGKTPRQKNPGNGKEGNEVMTYETTSCYSSVTYKCRKGTFTSKWSATKSKTGKLNPATFDVTDENGNIIQTDKDTDIPGKSKSSTSEKLSYFTAQKTGLEYEQFCRSILLAQGEFSRFLEADKDERSAILQKISGTEKYSEIGSRIAEHANFLESEKNKTNEKIEDLKKDCLSEEEIEENKKLLLQEEKLIKDLNEESQQNTADLLWYDELNKKEDEKKKDEEAKVLADEKLNTFREKEEVLIKGEKAVSCQSSWKELSLIRNQKKENEELKEELLKVLSRIKEKSEEAEKKKSESEKQLSEKENLQEKLKVIWKNVREADVKINNLNKQKDEAFLRKNNCEKEYAETEEELKEIENQLSENKTENDRLSAYLIENKNLSAADSKLPLIESNVSRLDEEKNLLKNSETEIQKIENQIADLNEVIKETEEQQKKYSGIIKENKWAENLEVSIEKGKAKKSAIEENDGKIISLKKEIETRENSISENKEKLLTLGSDFEKINEKLIDVYKNEGGFISTWLQKYIVKGKPCPVCGSIEHPSCDLGSSDNAEDNEKIKDVSDNIKKLEDEKNRIEKETALINQQLAVDESSVQKSREELKELEEKNVLLLKDLNELFVSSGKTFDFENIDSNIKEIILFNDQFQHAAEKISEIEKTDSENRKNAEILEQKKMSVSESREKVLKQIEEIKNELKCYFEAFGIDYKEDCEKSAYEKLCVKNSEYVDSSKKAEKLKSEYEILLQKKTLKTDEGNNRQKKLGEETEIFNKISGELKVLAEKRSELYGNKNPDDEETKLNEEIEELKASLEKCEKLFSDIKAEYSNTNGKLSAIETSYADLCNKEKSAAQKFQIEINEKGFNGEEDFNNCLLEENELNELREQKNKLEKDYHGAVISLEKSVEALKKHVASKREGIQEKETVKQRKDQIQIELKEANEKHAEINASLNANSKQQKELDKLKSLYQKQCDESARWKTVKGWIGNKEAAKFVNFVQGITLKRVIYFANMYLTQMTSRYNLESSDGVNFCLKDVNFQEIRTVSNISGGEKFLISLSLALGIARYSSHNIRVDSLFLDEGFGTLDEKILPVVLDTLKKLPADGKMLGIISHLPDVYASIDQRIEIESAPGGCSIIKGSGVSAL